MRIRVRFGLIDDKEVLWYRPLDDFPHLIKYLNRNYEWITYDYDPTGKVDHILVYSEVPTYDPNFGVVCPSWQDLFKDTSTNSCECGAKHTSFPWDHMRLCRQWRPW